MMYLEMGGDLEEVVKKLIRFREAGFDVYCDFKGHFLYSKNVTLDSAYLEVYGYTYSELIRYEAKIREERKERKENARKKKAEWIARGHKFISKELWEEWEKVIDICIEGIYNGREIESALNIIEAYENGSSMEKLKIIIDEHNDRTYIFLKSIITSFFSKGEELFQEFESFDKSWAQ